jgi:multidrug efflux pump subunit AcrB
MPLEEAIVEAGRVRVRPVLMTALIAILALLPLALGIGAGAEMQKPLAVAVIGGLAISPFFALLVGPVILLLIRGRRRRARRRHVERP